METMGMAPLSVAATSTPSAIAPIATRETMFPISVATETAATEAPITSPLLVATASAPLYSSFFSGYPTGVPFSLIGTPLITIDYVNQFKIWKKHTRDQMTYTKLKNEQKYSTWCQNFKAKAIKNGFQLVCDPNSNKVNCAHYAGLELYQEQLNFLEIVLHHILETPMGLCYLIHYLNSFHKVWFENHKHQVNSPFSKEVAQKIFVKPYEL